MKNERVWLTDWPAHSHDGYTDIPWPRVHAVLGADLIEWVHSRDHTQAQLILQQADHSDRPVSLWVEFYTADTRREFAVKFDK